MWNIPGLKREQGGFWPEQSGPLLLVEPVHTSSRQHNILYLGLDIGPLILHTNSRQGKNAPQILDSNSRQKKILVIESTVTNYESKIQWWIFYVLK
jgi:hypothetical protein